MKVLKEVTKWDVDYRQPNHTYLLDGDKIVAYKPWSGMEVRVSKTRKAKLDQRYRKFEEFKYVEADWPGVNVSTTGPAVKQVQGSKGQTYFVNTESGSCSCVGFSFRGACKHIKQIKETHRAKLVQQQINR